jgi:hypothetical protein
LKNKPKDLHSFNPKTTHTLYASGTGSFINLSLADNDNDSEEDDGNIILEALRGLRPFFTRMKKRQ